MQVRLKSCSRAHEAVSMPERPRAATGLEPTFRDATSVSAASVAPVAHRAPTAPITQAPPQSQAGFYGQQQQQQMTQNPYAMWPQVRVRASPAPLAPPHRALSPRQIRPYRPSARGHLRPLDPPIPSAGHDEPLRYRWSGHVPGLPGAFARHPSLSRLDAALATAAPPLTTTETERRRAPFSPPSFLPGELRRLGSRRGRRKDAGVSTAANADAAALWQRQAAAAAAAASSNAARAAGGPLAGPVGGAAQRERAPARCGWTSGNSRGSVASSPTASPRAARAFVNRLSARSWADASTRCPPRTSPFARSWSG